MKKSGTFLACVAALFGGPALAQQKHISKDLLQDMFADIQTKAQWNMKQNMLWGYFFTSTNKNELEKASTELTQQGYRLVEIWRQESDNPQSPPEWTLHVERVETHTVDTLDVRNSQLETLAGHYKAVIYDGMDVGPVPPSAVTH